MDAMASDCVPSGIGNGFRTKAILKSAIATPVKEWRQIAPALLQLIAFFTAIRLAEVWFRHHSLAASVLPIVDGASVSFVATLLAVHPIDLFCCKNRIHQSLLYGIGVSGKQSSSSMGPPYGSLAGRST